MSATELKPIQQWNPIQHDPDDAIVVGWSGEIKGLVSRGL